MLPSQCLTQACNLPGVVGVLAFANSFLGCHLHVMAETKAYVMISVYRAVMIS